jgi:TonB-linked SusC/RagA family outer membrane protein
MKRIFTILCILLWGSAQLFAQEGRVTGTVLDETGAQIPGVNVIIQGTTVGTITDLEGKFSLPGVSVGDVVVFSFVGMESQNVTVTSLDQVINVSLVPSQIGLDEVVVIGYGTQKKESVVGAIGTAQSEELRSQGNVTNLKDALVGVIPGMSVLVSSGLAGGIDDDRIYRETEILIRGRTTWNNASPLILVDGIERDMDDIDINEVESISVLKDASATAVFGVKGGNGVILITTKRGEIGKAEFNLEGEYSMETWSKIVQPADLLTAIGAYNYAVERTRRIDQSGRLGNYYSDEVQQFYRDGSLPYAFPNNSWLDIAFKDFAKSYRVNGTVRGGTERLRYFASAGYNHVDDLFNGQDIGQGYQPGYSYDRINVRSNFDVKVTSTTNLKVNFYGIQTFQSSIPGYQVNGFYSSISGIPANSMVHRYEDGVYGAYNPDILAPNPMYEINLGGLDGRNTTTVNMDYAIEQDLSFLTKGLNISGMIAYDNRFESRGMRVRDDGALTKKINPDFYLEGGYYDSETNEYKHADGTAANMELYTIFTEDTGGEKEAGFGWIDRPVIYTAESGEANRTRRNLYYEVRLNYARQFGRHDVTGLAGFTRQETVQGSDWPTKREDWIARATYNFDRRYFLEVNGAYNGSEKFGPGYKFDLFPSVGVSWNMANESFMKNMGEDWLDILKIRYSIGLVGNDRVNVGRQSPYVTIWEERGTEQEDLTRLDQSWFGYPYMFTGTNVYLEGVPGNPNLKWETARKQNLGLDLGFFNNRLSFTTDFWNEERYDMLIAADQREVPPVTGVPSNAAANLGEAKSRGMEFEVSHRNTVSGGFYYCVKANWSVARSEVIYKANAPLTPAHRADEGFPLNQTKTSMATGIIQSWDDLYSTVGSSAGGQNGQRMPGDVALLDFDADGLYESSDDVVPYGYPVYPQNNYGLSFGLNYKGLSFSILFAGAYNVTRNINSGHLGNERAFVPEYLLDRTWTYNPAGADFPALSRGPKWNPTGHYSRYDGSFFRLQNTQLSYALPKQWMSKIGMKKIEFYVNGRNLWMWSKMPDDGVGANHDISRYPTKKQFNLGLRLQF